MLDWLFTKKRATAKHPITEIPQVCIIVKELRGLVKVKFADGSYKTLNKAELIDGKIK